MPCAAVRGAPPIVVRAPDPHKRYVGQSASKPPLRADFGLLRVVRVVGVLRLQHRERRRRPA
ncbi:hypothetical protein ACWDYJ_28870 [Streptomyces sp. NPDC003042]